MDALKPIVECLYVIMLIPCIICLIVIYNRLSNMIGSCKPDETTREFLRRIDKEFSAARKYFDKQKNKSADGDNPRQKGKYLVKLKKLFCQFFHCLRNLEIKARELFFGKELP